jgi:hypothetical protein
MIRTAIAAYSNADLGGVEALGAVAAAMPGGFLEQAVSEAFRSIHTKASLAYAVRMLDSSNPRVRQNAIAAFSMFVLEVPLLNGSNRQELLDRQLNPAFRKKLDSDTENHIQLGAFPDERTEAESISWWKSWHARASK